MPLRQGGVKVRTGFEPKLPLRDCGISVIVLGELEWGVDWIAAHALALDMPLGFTPYRRLGDFRERQSKSNTL